jgi:cysteine-S-conjugate beta-lyase
MFDKIVERKNTNSYKWDKYAEDVLPMWVADMDFEIAEPITQALQKLVEHAVVGYSGPSQALLEVIVTRMQERHNWAIKKEWIVLLPGLVPGLHTAARCISETPCSIMTSTPVYRPFLESAGAEPNRHLIGVPFVWQNERWEMDFDTMESRVRPDTKMFMLCNPHNPNGRVFSEQELQKLADFCVKHELFICSDEIHCDLILDSQKKHVSIAALNPAIEALSISLLAPSKTFNIAGLGCSFAIIPDLNLRQSFEKAKYGMLPMPSAYAMDAAVAAYKDGEPWRQEVVAYLKSNHDYLLKEINTIKGLRMEPLEATYLAWINFEETGIEDFVGLLEKNGLGVQDASIFGGKGYFRLNFATRKALLEEGIEIIKKTLSD